MFLHSIQDNLVSAQHHLVSKVLFFFIRLIFVARIDVLEIDLTDIGGENGSSSWRRGHVRLLRCTRKSDILEDSSDIDPRNLTSTPFHGAIVGFWFLERLLWWRGNTHRSSATPPTRKLQRELRQR